MNAAVFVKPGAECNLQIQKTHTNPRKGPEAPDTRGQIFVGSELKTLKEQSDRWNSTRLGFNVPELLLGPLVEALRAAGPPECKASSSRKKHITKEEFERWLSEVVGLSADRNAKGS
jgi:hypothetical protein